MPIVDQQGRLFGRLNLLDAAVVLFLFALIPLGYASWIVFRTPAPVLTGVEPAVLMAEPEVRIVVQGVNLRPFMRVSLNTRQGVDFLFRDSSRAEVLFRDLAPGVYDAVLYDFEKERFRLPNAVTVTRTPAPPAQMVVVGALGNLNPEQAGQLKPGTSIAGFGEIAAVGTPLPQSTRVFAGSNTFEVRDPSAVRLPLAIRMGCPVRSREGHPVCAIGEVDLKPGVLVVLPTPFGPMPFQIDQMRSSAAVEPVRLTVRLHGDPRVLAQIRKGDVDLVRTANELSAGATVMDVAAPRADGREAVLEVQAQREATGWQYDSQPLRAGGPFMLRTPGYEANGVVLSVEPFWTP
jgi:hypothetical protein